MPSHFSRFSRFSSPSGNPECPSNFSFYKKNVLLRTDLHEFPAVTVELLVLLVSQGEVDRESRITAHVGKMR